ncbi:Isoflavone reductase family protein [Heracleum sosnowskyi]|uniref:Isoflavone reductase family protein n=1 Tax=Heracleum sosnowskyi TaxID=360622 RepID=A0AAD8N7Y1_9APIA|nr:Isoflavone reductase family protein [Heracleum sosnowskyi]
MGEQRQRFSFRLPWLAAPAPTRRPAPVTNNPSRATSSNNQPTANPSTTSQKSPSQSSSSSQTPKALPRASTSTKTSSKPTSTESPNITPQSATKTKNPAPTSTSPSQPIAENRRPSLTTAQPIRPATQTSPLRSPDQLVVQNSSSQDRAPPKQQPPSPSPANFQSRNSSQTSSQSRAGRQRRATSESPPTSNASPQSRPPSRTPIKSKNTSQSPLMSSQTGSPSKILNPTESTPPSPTFSNHPSPMSKNQNQATSQSQLQTHPEKDFTDEMISKAPIEATIKPIAAASSPQSDPPSTIPTPMAAEEMTEKYKEALHSNPPMLNAKQSKSTATYQSNKNRAGASPQKPMASNGEGISMQKEIKNDISKLTQKMATEQGKPVSIITLIGENKGATMQLGSPKEGAVHIHRGYKFKPDDSTETTTNGEKSSKDKRPKEENTKEDHMTKTYMNSNSQGINNSVVFKSSITERNPGVHLTLTQNPTEPIKTTTKENQLVAHKAEANVTPSQKLTYETRIRRRCLRGLLMESSDSDPDNPEKPRRHGCHCSYGDMNKDKEIDLL